MTSGYSHSHSRLYGCLLQPMLRQVSPLLVSLSVFSHPSHLSPSLPFPQHPGYTPQGPCPPSEFVAVLDSCTSGTLTARLDPAHLYSPPLLLSAVALSWVVCSMSLTRYSSSTCYWWGGWCAPFGIPPFTCLPFFKHRSITCDVVWYGDVM